MKNLTYNKLRVEIGPDAESVGAAASDYFAEVVNHLLSERDEVAVIMATGNSQYTFR